MDGAQKASPVPAPSWPCIMPLVSTLPASSPGPVRSHLRLCSGEYGLEAAESPLAGWLTSGGHPGPVAATPDQWLLECAAPAPTAHL